MTLTPETAQTPTKPKECGINVYRHSIWISKAAAQMMGNPRRVVVDMLATTLSVRPSAPGADGFEVKANSVWYGDFAIYCRGLSRIILKRYDAYKVKFELVQYGNVFELRPYQIEK